MVFRWVPVDGGLWRQTFDMSSGPENAKRHLGRPLDGGVGFRAQNMKDWNVVKDDAASTWNAVKLADRSADGPRHSPAIDS